MKTIQPISIWVNGKTVTANFFQISCNHDNMINEANFYYSLFDSNLIQLTNGLLTMFEPDYSQDWGSNDAAYNWAAIQLGLTITGEYIPPITE